MTTPTDGDERRRESGLILLKGGLPTEADTAKEKISVEIFFFTPQKGETEESTVVRLSNQFLLTHPALHIPDDELRDPFSTAIIREALLSQLDDLARGIAPSPNMIYRGVRSGQGIDSYRHFFYPHGLQLSGRVVDELIRVVRQSNLPVPKEYLVFIPPEKRGFISPEDVIGALLPFKKTYREVFLRAVASATDNIVAVGCRWKSQHAGLATSPL